MRCELDLKYSSFTYLFDESTMCAGFGGWKILSKKGRLRLISGWDKINIPSIQGGNNIYYRKQQKVTLKKSVYSASAGIAEVLGAGESLYTYAFNLNCLAKLCIALCKDLHIYFSQ